MTDNHHPITPPPHLVQQWANSAHREFGIATSAARWGADTELDACVQWIKDNCYSISVTDHLRAARRPKFLSLKEQALAKLPEHPEKMASHLKLTPGEVATIRRALEALPD